ncbi:hypothetical protein [Chitinophaga sp. CB10]|uniref:hypothetical protein n=1 Tax=Chitinophaga sp. CB10 TaxID=1891659 RepID=UPI0025C73773|nr:hypothetical protein [Chitinophaga sp. CB10]
MRNLTLICCWLLITAAAYAQKNITIVGAAQTVPAGKKWVIPINRKLQVEVPDGALQSGTLCNAALLTKNGSIGLVGAGPNPYAPLNIYQINISGVERAAFSGSNVLAVTPASFSWKSYETNAVATISQNLVFYEQDNVSVKECLLAIQAFEYNLTPAEVKQLQATRNAAIKKAAAKNTEKEETPDERVERYAREAYEAGRPVSDYYLANKPTLVASNDPAAENALKEVFSTLFRTEGGAPLHFLQQQSVTFYFDTLGHMTHLYADHLDEKRFLKPFRDYFTASAPGVIMLKNKEIPVKFSKEIKIQFEEESGEVRGTVKVSRNKDKSWSATVVPDSRMDSAYKAKLEAWVASRMMDKKPAAYHNAEISSRFTTYRVLLKYYSDSPVFKEFSIPTLGEIVLR